MHVLPLPVTPKDFQTIWWDPRISTADMVAMCRAKGMRVQEIAAWCGVSRRAVSEWQRGHEATIAHKSRLYEIARGQRAAWELLSTEDLKALHDDLAKIAKQRRKGEAEAAFVVMS